MTPEESANSAIGALVEAGELAGAAALVWRSGAVREVVAVGRRDLVSALPVERDTIFRIASLTKPATAAAALSMLDEGRFSLDEPVTRYAPELTRLRVLRDPEGPLEQSDEAAQLTPDQRAAARLFGQRLFAAGHGYGMGVAVVTDPETADPMRCRGGVGTIGWPGAYGSWWQADPNDQSVLIFFSHNMVELPQMARGIGLGVWTAISRFHAIATT